MDYPNRPPFFAHKFTRLLQKSCAAMDIGQQSCLLLVYIAHTEDAAHYSGHVRFWNEQLMTTMAFRSQRQLRDARQSAVDAGWLVYDRKHDRAVGRYFVTIPDRFSELSDGLIEDESDFLLVSNVQGAVQGAVQGSDKEPYKEVTRNVQGSVQPSNPNPNPKPIPKDADASAFKPPTLQEVTQYCLTRQNGVNAQAFVAHYESTGWRTKAGPVKSWQRCVGTFAKTAKPSQPPATGPPEGFEEFWEAFPRKEGKTAARALYVAALAMTDAANLLKGATGYGRTRRGEETKFTKSPAKWLEEERWTDVYPVPWYDLPDGSPELEKLAEEASRT